MSLSYTSAWHPWLLRKQFCLPVPSLPTASSPLPVWLSVTSRNPDLPVSSSVLNQRQGMLVFSAFLKTNSDPWHWSVIRSLYSMGLQRQYASLSFADTHCGFRFKGWSYAPNMYILMIIWIRKSYLSYTHAISLKLIINGSIFLKYREVLWMTALTVAQCFS